MFLPTTTTTTTTLLTFLSVIASSSSSLVVDGGSVAHGRAYHHTKNRNIAPNDLDAREFEGRAQPLESEIRDRSIASAGGWSLSVGNGTCPPGTASCFGDLTGVEMTTKRWNECCPIGSQPMLQCGTYVNTGQPYACCPLDNPDCRGDIETVRALNETENCVNSGWALWLIPDGGYNRFCCLPGQYGYWYKSLGQDAVGQCSNSSTLPEGSTPGQQVNNGDGTVDSLGNQIIALNYTKPDPAPTCDIIAKYGWSLQINGTDDDYGGVCTTGSSQCSNYAGACCPDTLNCGTVIGDAEVPVCCPASNPDCRGDVEGLWPQVCADSSWSLWHVNTNGNHFCCKPHEIGWNIINDVYALGYCGTHVPVANNTMRAILDYVGDGSTPGSSYDFPCDTSPAPNASLPDMLSAIVSPPEGLNPLMATASGIGNRPMYPNATAPVSINTALTAPLMSGTGVAQGPKVVAGVENFGYDNGGSATLTRSSTVAASTTTGYVMVTFTAEKESGGPFTRVTEIVPTEVATVLAAETGIPVFGNSGSGSAAGYSSGSVASDGESGSSSSGSSSSIGSSATSEDIATVEADSGSGYNSNSLSSNDRSGSASSDSSSSIGLNPTTTNGDSAAVEADSSSASTSSSASSNDVAVAISSDIENSSSSSSNNNNPKNPLIKPNNPTTKTAPELLQPLSEDTTNSTRSSRNGNITSTSNSTSTPTSSSTPAIVTFTGDANHNGRKVVAGGLTTMVIGVAGVVLLALIL